ncbi:MAG: glycosyltransferase [bacterium]|nr:glycosyltransferase [bacterium]
MENVFSPIPKVSVIIPAYNRAKYISKAIESVLNQSFKDFEIILIDDGSKDETAEIAYKYINDPRLKITLNDKNRGISYSRNRGLSLSKGEYIAMLDSDDVWIDSDKLAKQVKFLSENENHALVGTQVTLIDDNGKFIKNLELYSTSDESIRENMLLRNQFAQSSILIRKRAVLESGNYDENLRVWEDYDLWLKIGSKENSRANRKWQFANLPDFSLGYRVHEGSISNQKKTENNKLLLKIIRKYKDNYPNFKKAVLKAYLRIILK